MNKSYTVQQDKRLSNTQLVVTVKYTAHGHPTRHHRYALTMGNNVKTTLHLVTVSPPHLKEVAGALDGPAQEYVCVPARGECGLDWTVLDLVDRVTGNTLAYKTHDGKNIISYST